MQSTNKNELEGLAKRLSYAFHDIHLLRQALTHRSFLNEKAGEGMESNERLEFLGDAVLSTVVSHLLIEKFPDADEGMLSKFRARLVNENTLSMLARDKGVGRFILMGKGEELTGGREKSSILADAYEAVIASVYLDGGFASAFSLVAGEFSSLIDDVSAAEVSRDYKTELQEESQDLFKVAPRYRLISETGPEHDKIFEAEVLIHDEVFGKGHGKSKKEAEQKAAMNAMEILKLRKEKGDLT